jgi:hypothetical protein
MRLRNGPGPFPRAPGQRTSGQMARFTVFQKERASFPKECGRYQRDGQNSHDDHNRPESVFVIVNLRPLIAQHSAAFRLNAGERLPHDTLRQGMV